MVRWNKSPSEEFYSWARFAGSRRKLLTKSRKAREAIRDQYRQLLDKEINAYHELQTAECAAVVCFTFDRSQNVSDDKQSLEEGWDVQLQTEVAYALKVPSENIQVLSSSSRPASVLVALKSMWHSGNLISTSVQLVQELFSQTVESKSALRTSELCSTILEACFLGLVPLPLEHVLKVNHRMFQATQASFEYQLDHVREAAEEDVRTLSSVGVSLKRRAVGMLLFIQLSQVFNQFVRAASTSRRQRLEAQLQQNDKLASTQFDFEHELIGKKLFQGKLMQRVAIFLQLWHFRAMECATLKRKAKVVVLRCERTLARKACVSWLRATMRQKVLQLEGSMLILASGLRKTSFAVWVRYVDEAKAVRNQSIKQSRRKPLEVVFTAIRAASKLQNLEDVAIACKLRKKHQLVRLHAGFSAFKIMIRQAREAELEAGRFCTYALARKERVIKRFVLNALRQEANVEKSEAKRVQIEWGRLDARGLLGWSFEALRQAAEHSTSTRQSVDAAVRAKNVRLMAEGFSALVMTRMSEVSLRIHAEDTWRLHVHRYALSVSMAALAQAVKDRKRIQHIAATKNSSNALKTWKSNVQTCLKVRALDVSTWVQLEMKAAMA
eukprot:2615855-Rhodomonas_salina.1